VVGEVIAERYELQEVVGTGGMSSVYRAHDRLLERTVALKVLHEHYSSDEDYIERFRREARAAAQLTHPGIVTVIDRGEQGGRQFIVFEHVAGETLKDVIDREGRLPVPRALELALEVARALQFAHERGLVHRDVKPQNVLLNGDGRAKVTDFGIAREVDVEQSMTQTGTVLGTSHYLAPEQARGEVVDEKSDVYALGAVLFELLTGEVPFPGDSFVAVAMRHIHEPPRDVRELRLDVPPRVAAAVGRALEKDPARRFPTMRDFANELKACLTELTEVAPAENPTMVVPPSGPPTQVGPAAPAPSYVPGRRKRRWWPLVLALLVLVAGGAIAAGVLLKNHVSALGGGGSPPKPVAMTAVATYDPPPGDGQEQDLLIPDATDGDQTTAWQTEHYTTAAFGNLKSGVGLVVQTHHAPRKLSSLTVTSDTPGWTAVIKAGSSESGAFKPVSKPQTVGHSATFSLDVPSPVRYYLIWITRLASRGYVDVNEVTAKRQ
jgi:eukaryotic-like serine/threonine-protein kinase